eukprot:2859463-Prymnesium_polylepis.1
MPVIKAGRPDAASCKTLKGRECVARVAGARAEKVLFDGGKFTCSTVMMCAPSRRLPCKRVAQCPPQCARRCRYSRFHSLQTRITASDIGVGAA